MNAKIKINKATSLALVLAVALAGIFAMSIVSDGSDGAGETESNPLIWYNNTIILLPEIVEAEATGEQVNYPPQNLVIVWGDGTSEVVAVNGYVSKGSLEVRHDFAKIDEERTYHITCTPQATDKDDGTVYKYDTYEMFVTICGAPSVYFYDGDESVGEVVAENGYGVGQYSDNYFTTVEPIDAPTKDGFTFAGWFDAKDGGNLFDFTTPITNPTIVFAHYDAVSQVTITVDGQETVVGNGTTVADLTVPTKDGYTFAGWYADNTFTTPVSSETALTEGMTLFAKFDKIVEPTETVTVVINGVETEFEEGTTVADLTVPTKDGYTFAGWYADNTFTTPVSSETVLTDAMNLFAKFDKNAQTGGDDEDNTDSEDKTNEISIIPIIVVVIGGIIAVVGLRFHPAILIVGVIVAIVGIVDVSGLVNLF